VTTLSELQRKEVVMMHTGEKLGFIDDLEINEQTGFIMSIVIIDRQLKGSFFNKPEEMFISWAQIVTIGKDIILIDQTEKRIEDTKIEEKTD